MILHRWLFSWALLGVGACWAHPKDGVFVEGGLMTGLLETQEDLEEKSPCAQGVICPALFMRNANPVFTSTNIIGQSFSTTAPIKISLTPNKTLEIKNLLPYNLHNVDIYMQTPEGHRVKIATIQYLPQFTKSFVDTRYLPAIAHAGGNPNSVFSLAPSSSSGEETTRVLNALQQISVDIQAIFTNPEGKNWQPFSVADAKNYIDVLLNMSYMLSSSNFKDAVLHAPFNFANASNEGSEAIPMNTNGTLKTDQEKYDLKPEDVLQKYTKKIVLNLGVVGPGSEAEGWGREATSYYPGLLGVRPGYISPQDEKVWTNYSAYQDANDIAPMQFILHEFGHAKGYSHDGNMTYQHGWYWKFSNTDYLKLDSPDGYWYKEGNHYVRAGMVGVGETVWINLGMQNKLPINYNQIAHASAPTYLSNFMRTLENMTSTHLSSHAAEVGFNIKSGYQQYFANWFGLSYYGLLKYNFSKKTGFIKSIHEVALGVGADMLIDFKTAYTTQRYKTRNKTRVAKIFKSSWGIFGGLRALWKGYDLGEVFANSGNLDVATGFNYRYKHSKYSLGAAIPLIAFNMKVAIDTKNLLGSVIIKEGPRHFNVFFNYGWVF